MRYINSLSSALIILLFISIATFTASAQDNGTKTIVDVAKENGDFTTLLTALNATNHTHTLNGEGPFTVFAPTDEAFAALPAGTVEALLNNTSALKKILLYHVAKGRLTSADVVNMSYITTLEGQKLPVNVTDQGVFVGNAMITMADVNASNGVIHVIDAVLIPPVQPQQKDIIETATDAGNFTTLLTALNATNLTDTLKGKGPFTVFAPTDEAFAALPAGTVEALLNNTSALKKILLYHVAKGRLTAADVVNMSYITTLEGEKLPVNVTTDGVYVGKAKIIIADVNASNGVIHVIDTVLIPPPQPPQKYKILCSGKAPLRVKFIDRNTKHTNWNWSFGDGKASRSQNTVHIYKKPGKYPVSLTVKTSGHYIKTLAGYVVVK